jgi:hypothetical protein
VDAHVDAQHCGPVVDALGQALAMGEPRDRCLRFLVARLQHLIHRPYLANVVCADYGPAMDRRRIVRDVLVPCREHDRQAVGRIYDEQTDRMLAPYAAALMREAEHSDDGAAMLACSQLPVDTPWRESPLRRGVVQPLGYDDLFVYAWCGSGGMLFVVTLHSRAEDGPLDRADRQIVRTMCRLMRPLVSTYLAEDPADASVDLPPAQREVLKLALTGASER